MCSAGNDDPNLPLVTCSADHQHVYLLDKSIMSGEEIKTAGSGLDQQRGDYVVDVEFKSGGSKTWADFTAANVGTQTALHAGLPGRQCPGDPGGDPRWPHPDHRTVHRLLGARTGQRPQVRFAAAVLRVLGGRNSLGAHWV